MGSETFQLLLTREGWEPVFPLRSLMLEGRLAASLLQNFLGKWWEALQDPGGTSGPHPHPTSRKLNVYTSLGNCFFCLLSPLPLVSQKRAKRLLELGHIRVYFAIALWGIMGCLRLCLGIDLQLHSCVSAWMYGEDFAIAVGCPRLPRNERASLRTPSPPGVKGASGPLKPNDSCGSGRAEHYVPRAVVFFGSGDKS